MRKLIWLSYEMGLNGDFESLYYWLDQHKARECGDSVATFFYSYEKDLIAELQEDLKSNVNMGAKERFYVIYRSEKGIQSEEGKLRGKFIFGKRKRAPWVGLADYEEEVEDED